MEITTGKYHVTINGNWKVQADSQIRHHPGVTQPRWYCRLVLSFSEIHCHHSDKREAAMRHYISETITWKRNPLMYYPMAVMLTWIVSWTLTRTFRLASTNPSWRQVETEMIFSHIDINSAIFVTDLSWRGTILGWPGSGRGIRKWVLLCGFTVDMMVVAV